MSTYHGLTSDAILDGAHDPLPAHMTTAATTHVMRVLGGDCGDVLDMLGLRPGVTA